MHSYFHLGYYASAAVLGPEFDTVFYPSHKTKYYWHREWQSMITAIKALVRDKKL